MCRLIISISLILGLGSAESWAQVNKKNNSPFSSTNKDSSFLNKVPPPPSAPAAATVDPRFGADDSTTGDNTNTGTPQSETEVDKEKFSKANPEDITNENFPTIIKSFDYANRDIGDVVKAISKLTGKNFILDDNVRGKISIIAPTQITVAEAYKAFLSALAMKGLTIVPSGRFLKIRQARKAQRGESIETYSGAYFPNTDQLITRIVKLKYINAKDLKTQIKFLASPDGEATVHEATNTLIITDWGSHIERVMNIVDQLDIPGFEEKLVVISIKHAKAADVADIIQQIIDQGSGGKSKSRRFSSSSSRFKKGAKGGTGAETYKLVLPDPRTNSIIVVGNSAGIKKIRKLVKQLDTRLRPEDAGGVYVYYVRHGESEKIANVLNGIATGSSKSTKKTSSSASSAGGASRTGSGSNPLKGQVRAVFGGDVKVTAEKDNNSLIITASKQDYRIVRDLLKKIDIARDQVFVKAIIMEMNASKETNWGIDYYQFNPSSNGIGRIGFRGSSDIGSVINPAADSGAVLGFGSGKTFNLNFGGGTIEVTSLVGLVKFLKKNVGGNVLSTPQIMAIDNEEAEIEVGETIPVGTSTATTGSTTTSSITREDATIKLVITPFISPDTDSVRLKIKQTIKQLSATIVRASALADSAVVTSNRNISTTIVVNSGDTAVLGGLMTDQETEDVTKIPVLGDIPIIGWLFKSRTTSLIKQSLVVFITPTIIRNSIDSSDLLNSKLNERIEFIQKNMNGRDPYGSEVEKLPRRTSRNRLPEDMVNEEPAVETF